MMKIRMRAHHEQVRNANLVQEENPLRSYWITQGDLAGMSIVYHQPDWEPVPEEVSEERWVDVTKQCEHVVSYTPTDYPYRLRKVNLHSLNTSSELSSVVSAFIVEKKV